MEIDANIKWGSVNGVPPATRSAAAAQPAAETDSFANTSALESALRNTPDVRPPAVANGRALVNSPDYPTGETVKQLSDFLANKLQSDLE